MTMLKHKAESDHIIKQHINVGWDTSCSHDGLARIWHANGVVWDINANELMQQFRFHSGSILDVDWRTNRTFASGSTNTMIYVCKIGENQSVKFFLDIRK
ncbi:WD40 repeat-containing protein HOS15-like [Helianthus annuus]|uniref:WD40 repeat-containing protein HOS15-like n=1 Tax=Helianthus annuus TaxID=4232 RepID=UPI0016533E73|nr:WD40 repeat-containing protein HOS15-like [Helianthus annuus]